VLMRLSAVCGRQPVAFQPGLSLTGGEDGELFNWLRSQGAQVVWCNEACAEEHQPARRLRLRYHLYRNLQFSVVHWRGHYARCGAFKVVLHAAGGAAAGPVLLLLGGLLFPVLPLRGAPLMMTGMRCLGRPLALSTVQLPGYGPGHDTP
jgi:hypothetical protein